MFLWSQETKLCLLLRILWSLIEYFNSDHWRRRRLKPVVQSTHFPSRVLSSAATGSREYLSGTKFPSGRPRWLISTTDLAPWSRQCLMVGTAALILKINQVSYQYVCVLQFIFTVRIEMRRTFFFLPLVVCDMLVLHGNIEVNPGREQRERDWWGTVCGISHVSLFNNPQVQCSAAVNTTPAFGRMVPVRFLDISTQHLFIS